MRTIRSLVLLVLVVMGLAACGSTKTITSTTTVTSTTTAAPAPSQPNPCPPNHAFAGCSRVGKPTPPTLSFKLAPVSGPEFPDVSSFQRQPGWQQVKAWQQSHGWPTGGVFKMGEYHLDPFAFFNSTRLSQLHMWKAGYWFLRDTGCSKEAGQIISAARSFGLKLVWLDSEVPEAKGYTTCLIPPIKAAGFSVGVYTGPGSWPGGETFGAPLWDAAYNFFGPSTNGLWTSKASCWQFTDGTFASRTFVPGIGFDDVSVDLQGGACAKLAGATPKPSDPFAIMDHTKRHFPGGVVASEYNTMRTIRRAGCHGKPVRQVCKSSKYHLQLLEGRLLTVAQTKHPHWANGRGARQTIMAKQLAKMS